MRTGSHFDSSGMGGKFGAGMRLGKNGFGANSSKHKPPPAPVLEPGAMTAAMLAQHDASLAAERLAQPIPEDEAI